jgi:hypothetical protein
MKTSVNHSRTKRQQLFSLLAVFAVLGLAAFAFIPARSAGVAVGYDKTAAAPDTNDAGGEPAAAPQERKPPAPSDGCVKCHTGVGDPHQTKINNGPSCVDCHGGNGTAALKEQAHTAKPKHPEKWHSSANPEDTFTLLNNENWDWIRFVNPSDLRVAEVSCGGTCHGDYIKRLQKSAMTNSPQVYSTALYNNGSLPTKYAIIGENYSPSGEPQIARTIPPPTEQETREKDILPFLLPFPRFEIGQPLSVAFWRPVERGGGPKSETGNPNREDVPGQPDVTLSNRGYGTQARVDPVILGAQKVRLNDPVMSFMGTNNAPGDYRQSGCASCHVVYANDRSEYNSGPYAKFGNRGTTRLDNPDPTIPKNEKGHPLEHKFTKSIPSSQCITCHVHNGNGFINTYLGYMWWDEQTDGEFLYPKKQKNPSPEELDKAGNFNPEEAAARGKWGDPEFLFEMSDLNKQMRHMQVSDYHGHGWVFRRAYKMDRKGQFLDKDDKVIPYDDPDLYESEGKPGKAIHLKDIHLEKGMHCVDCHFSQDNHGTNKIYGDRRAVIEISCEDCHGTVNKKITASTARTSGFGAPEGGNSMIPSRGRPFNRARFIQRGDKLFQRSMVEQNDPATGKIKEWEVPQVADTVTPGNPRYNPKSARAKTILRDNETWGAVPSDSKQLAHDSAKVSCVSCHSSWTTNCWGCHLSASVNTRKAALHEEGDITQVYPSYNPQVLRTDGYMLGIDGSVQNHKVMPVRSSSAVTVSITNAQRSVIVNHAPTISSAGYNGNAFNTHPPHTVRGAETKQCTDCHVSKENDNNSWVGSVLMQGSNQVNFMGRYIYVAEGNDGLSATEVAELTEPQAVLGGHLHQIAYPDWYARHQARGGKLRDNYAHRSADVNQVQMYGEFLLAATGDDGFIVYDAANVADKDFSQRIVDSPFSKVGQKLYVRTKDATGVAVGSPAPLDTRRNPGQTADQRRWLELNEEQPLAPLFGYAFISDRQEGLVTVDITTLTDGVNTNNHLKRGATFNPEGRLTNARGIWIVGNYAYLLTDRALQIVNIGDPLNPRWVSEVTSPLRDPRSLAVQFRYCFVTDAEGLKVFDVTDLEHPRAVAGATVPLRDAHSVYPSREYAYVGAGADGLAIVDIQKPEQPKLDQLFNDGGKLSDTRDVKIGMAYASLFAYVADGRNGLKVIELTNPNSVPGNMGYSPRPAPRVVAYYPTKGAALQVSEGYRRDRAVDESGNQIAVFGRRGARPFNLEEQRRMYLRDGKLYTVTDEPGQPTAGKAAQTSWLQSLSKLFGFGWLGLGLVIPAAFVWQRRRRTQQ